MIPLMMSYLATRELMADYPYYDEDPKRRAKRRRRRNYTDDAWGMAYYEDSYDGDAADIGNWAGGMVDEEGRRFEDVYDPNRADTGDYAPSDYPRSRYFSRNYSVPSSRSEPSPAVDRAKRLAGRMSERNSYAPGPPAGRAGSGSRVPPPPRADGFEVSWQIVLPLLLALVTVCSCGVLVLYYLVG